MKKHGSLYLATFNGKGCWEFECEDMGYNLENFQEYILYVKDAYKCLLCKCKDIKVKVDDNLWKYGSFIEESDFHIEFNLLHIRIVSTLIGDMEQPYWIEKQPNDLIEDARNVIFNILY